MNTENLEYLKTKLEFLGFDNHVIGQLEQKIKEGKPEFTLEANAIYGTDNMQALIHFRQGEKDGKQAYFCNNYIATLQRADQNRSQFIYVNNKGQSITFKEACNLLNSRSVFKEITPKEGEKYNAWLRIDHEKIDPKTNYPKLRQFSGNWGFDLKEAIGRVDFKGMKYDDQLRKLMQNLEKGNVANVTLLKNGQEVAVSIESNPQQRTLNMYNQKGGPMFYPGQRTEQQYGQAPSDATRQNASVVNEPGLKYEKKDLLAKNKPSNGLMEKRNTRGQSRSRHIS